MEASLASLQQQCQAACTQQASAFGEGVAQLEQILKQLQAVQSHLLGADDDASEPSESLSILVSRVSKSSQEAKTKLTRDFKALHGSLTKLGGKVDKTFAANMEEFCTAELFGAPGYVEAAAEGEGQAAPAQPLSAPVMPFASLVPVSSSSSSSAALASSTSASSSLSSSQQHYARAFSLLMEESWLRDGRMELVEQLRAEQRQREEAVQSKSTTAASSPDTTLFLSASPSLAELNEQDDDDGAADETAAFTSLHAMVRAMRHPRRDTSPCMRWVEGEEARIQAQIRQVEEHIREEKSKAEMESQAASAAAKTSSGTTTAASDARSALASTRRKRVSFSGESKSGAEEGAEAKSSTTPTARLSSLRAHLSSLQSEHSSLHSLRFDLHRLRFLQILGDSEAPRPAAPGSEARRRSRKRKKGARGGHEEGERASDVQDSVTAASSSSSSASSSRRSTRPFHRSTASSGSHVESEEAAAMAADQTSSSSSSDAASSSASDTEQPRTQQARRQAREECEEDAQLNALAATASRRAGIVTPATVAQEARGSSGSQHHAALKYAQQFFPQFAATRMEDIRRLSGCLLFMGDLSTASSSSSLSPHPYADLFSREGNRRLWQQASQRVQKVFLEARGRGERNPVEVCLQACDLALPQLLKYQSVLRLNREMVSVAKGVATNPEIDLGSSFQYHSTFICPVTKEQCSSTADSDVGAPTIDLSNIMMASGHPMAYGMLAPSPPMGHVPGPSHAVASSAAASAASASPSSSNPPVLLKCGHCISQHAMEKIVRTLRMSRRFKCPTCPQEQSHTEVLILHL